IQLVGPHAMRGVFDAVQNVIEAGRQGLDVFRIERSDEGLIEAGENIVRDLVALALQSLDLLAGFGELRVPGCSALQHQAGRFGDIFHLLQKQGEEFFFAGQQFHTSSSWRNMLSGRHYLSNSLHVYCYSSVTIGKSSGSAATGPVSESRYRVSSRRLGFRFPIAESIFCLRSG